MINIGSKKLGIQSLRDQNILSNDDTVKVKPSLDANGNLSYYDFGGDHIIDNRNSDFVMIGVAGPDSTIFDAEFKNY